jgi:hypothetical protein
MNRAVTILVVTSRFTWVVGWVVNDLFWFIKQKGGQPRQLIGRDQLLLAIYMTAYPDAEIEECAAYILNNGGGLHSTSTISRRMQEL